MQNLALACALANESSVSFAGGKYSKIGESTETALVVLVEKLNVFGLPVDTLTDAERVVACTSDIRKRFPRDLGKGFCLEFDRDRKSMSVYVEEKGKGRMFCKGASEKVLERCSHVQLSDGSTVALTKDLKENILQTTYAYGTGAIASLLVIPCEIRVV